MENVDSSPKEPGSGEKKREMAQKEMDRIEGATRGMSPEDKQKWFMEEEIKLLSADLPKDEVEKATKGMSPAEKLKWLRAKEMESMLADAKTRLQKEIALGQMEKRMNEEKMEPNQQALVRFAFEAAYLPNIRDVIAKAIKTKELKLNPRDPLAWILVDRELTQKGGPFYSEEYVALRNKTFPEIAEAKVAAAAALEEPEGAQEELVDLTEEKLKTILGKLLKDSSLEINFPGAYYALLASKPGSPFRNQYKEETNNVFLGKRYTAEQAKTEDSLMASVIDDLRSMDFNFGNDPLYILYYPLWGTRFTRDQLQAAINMLSGYMVPTQVLEAFQKVTRNPKYAEDPYLRNAINSALAERAPMSERWKKVAAIVAEEESKTNPPAVAKKGGKSKPGEAIASAK